jgi:hypothetical protein
MPNLNLRIPDIKYDTDLSSLPSIGLFGSGCLFKVLQPFNPLTDAPLTEACV